MNLDDDLRAELRAAHVSYDAHTAEQMIASATSRRRVSTRWAAPLATAAAVAALVAGGTALAMTGGGGGGGSTPAAAGASRPVAYATPSTALPATSANAALPADLKAQIEDCVATEGAASWGESNHCANVESQCEVANALGESPCSLIPTAVVCDAPSYVVPVKLADGAWSARMTSGKADLCPDLVATGAP